MELHDIEHFSRIVAGCESVTEHLDWNVGMSEEGRYTYAVLQLHAQDEGLIEGTEGFLDNIKKGARSAVKWVKEMAKAVKEWVVKVVNIIFGKNVDGISTEAGIEFILPALKSAQAHLSDINANDVSALKLRFNPANVLKTIDKTITALESKSSGFQKQVKEVKDLLWNASKELSEKIDKLSEGDNEEASKLGRILKTVTSALGELSSSVKSSLAKSDAFKYNLTLQKQVDSGNLSRIRSALINEIEDMGLTTKERKEIVSHLVKQFPDLFDAYEENTLAKDIEKDKAKWDEDTYTLMTSYANVNFSKERISNLIDMSDYLREKGLSGFRYRPL